MKDIILITTEHHINNRSIDSDGHYNILKHGESFLYEAKKYTYHSSGLARTVYVSDCGYWVIKVPNTRGVLIGELEMFLEEGNFHYADPCIHHNYYEAKAYEDCPGDLKHFLAKTELLPNCWVRQEFVKVFDTNLGRHDLREAGQRSDGSICIFDFDPFLFDFVYEGYDWMRLPQIISNIKLNTPQ